MLWGMAKYQWDVEADLFGFVFSM